MATKEHLIDKEGNDSDVPDDAPAELRQSFAEHRKSTRIDDRCCCVTL
jgi:hypothetical protein